MPSSSAFSTSAAMPKPVARSPKIGADADDEVNLDSDDEEPSAGKKRRASPAAELTAFLNDTPPPAKDSAASSSPRNNSPTPYFRSSPSIASKLSVTEPSIVRPTSAAPPAPTAKPKKGLKGLMSKVLGSGHTSQPAPPVRNFDRSRISQPTAAAPGVAETMRARTAALDTRANVLDQPTKDLLDRSASVGFPSATSPVPSANLQPPTLETDSSHVRSRPTSALSVSSYRSDGESQRPRNDGPPRSRAVSQISQTSIGAGSISSGRPMSATIPWGAGNEAAPQDRLKAPVRSMSISRKPVSPELRNAVDLPMVSPMSSPSGAVTPLPIIDSPPHSPVFEASRADDTATQSPSRIQKSIASAAAHTAMAPPILAFGAPAWTTTGDENGEQCFPVEVDPLTTVSTLKDEEPGIVQAPSESAATPEILSVPYTPAAPADVGSPSSAASPPSVPLSELVHLRSLLANATTADECRLLVNALLSLWKVPSAGLSSTATDSSAADTSAMEAQVARVFSWLLSETGMLAVSSAQTPATSAKDALPASSAVPAAPGTPFVIPPTPVEPAAGRFAPDTSLPETIDEAASIHSSAEEELEEAEYEARVIAGRAALMQAVQQA